MATQTLLFAELAPDPLLGFPEPLLESVWARESNGPAPNCARLIKEQNGNIRAALMALEMRLYAA
jgi:hypothetical protein